MKVNIKKLHPDAVVPKYAKNGDAGLDLVATGYSGTTAYIAYETGLAIEIPKGFIGLIFPRSSIRGRKQFLANSVGVIDSGYRGEIIVTMKPTSPPHLPDMILPKYDVGDKVAQLIIMPYPQIELTEVEELSSTERGEGGHGSTGK